MAVLCLAFFRLGKGEYAGHLMAAPFVNHAAAPPDAIKCWIVHCSDTPDNEPLRAIDIQQMHLGFGWDGIGYHYVIGTRPVRGRPPRILAGRACQRHHDQIWRLIGRTHFTTEQMHRRAVAT